MDDKQWGKTRLGSFSASRALSIPAGPANSRLSPTVLLTEPRTSPWKRLPFRATNQIRSFYHRQQRQCRWTSTFICPRDSPAIFFFDLFFELSMVLCLLLIELLFGLGPPATTRYTSSRLQFYNPIRCKQHQENGTQAAIVVTENNVDNCSRIPIELCLGTECWCTVGSNKTEWF